MDLPTLVQFTPKIALIALIVLIALIAFELYVLFIKPILERNQGKQDQEELRPLQFQEIPQELKTQTKQHELASLVQSKHTNKLFNKKQLVNIIILTVLVGLASITALYLLTPRGSTKHISQSSSTATVAKEPTSAPSSLQPTQTIEPPVITIYSIDDNGNWIELTDDELGTLTTGDTIYIAVYSADPIKSATFTINKEKSTASPQNTTPNGELYVPYEIPPNTYDFNIAVELF